MLFVTNNRNEFTVNSEIYRINTRQQKLPPPSVNFKEYKKGIYYLGKKVYNNLSQHINVAIRPS
jgi:hypothetical protein